jgi:hypothetical protein
VHPGLPDGSTVKELCAFLMHDNGLNEHNVHGTILQSQCQLCGTDVPYTLDMVRFVSDGEYPEQYTSDFVDE